MNLSIWDVQHGSAAYLRTPTGRHMVFDLGIGDTSLSDATFSPLKHLQRLGISRLDQVTISHPHRDHLDDIFEFDSMWPAVLHRPRHLTEADIRGGNRPGDSRIIDKYLEIDRRYSLPVPSGYDVGDPGWGMDIAYFTPTACPRDNLNNHSIVTFLRHAGSTVCLPGDNEAPSWRELLQYADFRQWLQQVDVLIAPHHGREAGYCEDIFAFCRPKLVVVSDGPAGPTNAVAQYSNQASGWGVWSRATGRQEQRRVVTTRSDDSVFISTGFDAQRLFLQVTIR